MSFIIHGKYSDATIFSNNVEEECVAQITRMINHPAFTKPVAIMPDTHAGKGSVIGFTMPLGDKVIPNVVGVDIGCGMLVCEVGGAFDEINHELLDHKIRQSVPFGFDIHESKQYKTDDWIDWEDLRHKARQVGAKFNCDIPTMDGRFLGEVCNQVNADRGYVERSLGTLGGGNHFIEFCESKSGLSYFIIHTGSRNFGLKICNYWQKRAEKRLKKLRTEDLKEAINNIKQTLPNEEWQKEIRRAKERLGVNVKVKASGLEWLEDDDKFGYLFSMILAQGYAAANRKAIAHAVLKALGIKKASRTLETIHNYINFDDMTIRKGAVSAHKDEEFVVPLNMKEGSLLCVGKGNEDWNCSAPHGAGRKMSRSQAKKKLSLDAFQDEMSSIFSTSVGRSTLDEAPGAYKDSSEIIDNLSDTADILDVLKPLHNMKAA